MTNARGLYTLARIIGRKTLPREIQVVSLASFLHVTVRGNNSTPARPGLIDRVSLLAPDLHFEVLGKI